LTRGAPSSSLARVRESGGRECTTASPPGHNGESRRGEPTGGLRLEDMPAASFTASKYLSPLAVRSGALLPGRLLRCCSPGTRPRPQLRHRTPSLSPVHRWVEQVRWFVNPVKFYAAT
jgi:hypothetical protein